MKVNFVPVVNSDNQPLMPTIPSRARKWITSGKATGFWKKGVFCVRLNVKTEEDKQGIVIGIDPGSKKEGFTVKSQSHTYFNIQADAVTWVKDRMETRKNARKSRRQRKTPCRQPRFNRKINKNFIAPSIKARWQWKLRIVNWLNKMFPVSHVIVEDVKAKTKKGQTKWNESFSPLEIGKDWFYLQLFGRFKLTTKRGHETKELRNSSGLHKIGNKLSKSFDAHCVDSWVLANSIVGGHIVPDNKEILYIFPILFHRRQLHMFCPTKGGKRRRQGGTMSLRYKRGSMVKHKKYSVTYVGGWMNERISLYNSHREIVSRCSKVEDCKFLTYNSWVIN